MIFGIITLLSALAISAVAAYFSIVGLAELFAATFIPVIIMATVLEAGKLVSAVWLHRNWRTAPLLIRAYLIFAVLALMLITSMGIFGFLSKGHLEQEAPAKDLQIRIERVDDRIQSQKQVIEAEEERLAQLDSIIATLIEYDKISGPDGARAVRKRQQDEREEIQSTIESSFETIDELQDKRTELKQSVTAVEAKLGPVQYVTELLYANPENNMDKAIRTVILIIMFAFDPLAVMMVIASSHSFLQAQRTRAEHFDKQSEEQHTYENKAQEAEDKPKHMDPETYRQKLRERQSAAGFTGWLKNK